MRPTDSATAIATGLCRTGRAAQHTERVGNVLRLARRGGGYYWISFDGAELRLGETCSMRSRSNRRSLPRWLGSGAHRSNSDERLRAAAMDGCRARVGHFFAPRAARLPQLQHSDAAGLEFSLEKTCLP